MHAAARREGATAATGSARLVAHCSALQLASHDPRGLARARLETALGPELAERLVAALAAGGRRGWLS